MDRAAMRSDWNHFRQLAFRRKVAGGIGIVGLWKCGIMRLWDYGIGLRRFQFQNSIMLDLEICGDRPRETVVKWPFEHFGE